MLMQRMLTEAEKLEIIEREWAKARAKHPIVVIRVNVEAKTDESGKPKVHVLIAFSKPSALECNRSEAMT